ncbi:MAG TPA: hypothetical protein VGQ06_09880 [Gemmatimonadales bacterium]|nr:hypothetical protein [Gemmatimonadales bacterium]
MTRLLRRAVLPSSLGLVLGCGGARVPASMRGYEILVERRDPQSAELARALREYGFRIRGAVRGGSRPTAALIYFTFRAPGPGEREWLHLRLADTRSGVIIGAASVPLDSLGPTPRARAQAAIQALVATPIPSPP